MKTFILKAAIFVLFINAVCGWRHFWKGRKFNGNLGDPTHFHLKLGSASEDLWFTQNLDHFEPLNRKTWNQVTTR